jgi:histidine triad (HIT) family protein
VTACLFCGIVAGDVPAEIVHEDEHTVTFADIEPQAPTHLLVIPRQHIADVAELGRQPGQAAAMLAAVSAIVEKLGISDFRTVFNTGVGGGQHVFHVHAHLLAGRVMTWPPG